MQINLYLEIAVTVSLCLWTLFVVSIIKAHDLTATFWLKFFPTVLSITLIFILIIRFWKF